jgi:hypothetical protein
VNIVTTSLTRFLENLREKPARTLYICHVVSAHNWRSVCSRDDAYATNNNFCLVSYVKTRDDLIGKYLSPTQLYMPLRDSTNELTQPFRTKVGFLGEFQRRRDKSEKSFQAALIICGRREKYNLSSEVIDMLKVGNGPPVMVIGYATNDAMNMIHDFTPKLNIHDTNRVKTAVDHYEPYIDFDELLRRTQSGNSSFNEPGSLPLDALHLLR